MMTSREATIGKLKDITSHISVAAHPFLYYLPQFLERGLLTFPNSTGLILFVEKAIVPYKDPLVEDALKILNQLVDPEDMSLITPRPSMFDDNRHFFWKEFGDFTDVQSVASHIINKVIVVLSLGRPTT